MPSRSKDKGKENEVCTAAVLSKWWGRTFKSIPNSGALRWKGAAFTYGDLLPPEDFPCITECKWYKYVEMDELLHKPVDKGYITWWWYHQVWLDVQRCFAETQKPLWPILIYCSNRRPYRVALDERYVAAIFRLLPIGSMPASYLSNVPGHRPFRIFHLASFLEAVSPAIFKQAYEDDLAYLKTYLTRSCNELPQTAD